MPPFVIRTLLDGRARTRRYLRQAALLAASWHAAARAVAPLEVRLIGETSARLRAFLRELEVPLVAAPPDPNDAWAKTANCISAAYRDGDARILLLDNDTAFLSPPDALTQVPEDACAAAVAGKARISTAQWRQIERVLGLAALPTELSTLQERYQAQKKGRRPASMERLYVNAGVLLLPSSRVFPGLWSRDVTRIRELFQGHELANDAVCASCQAGLATALGHHRHFVPLPAGFNYRPLQFVLGDHADERPVLLHMTGGGEVPEYRRIEGHLDAYWTAQVERRLGKLRGRIGTPAYDRRLERLAHCKTLLARVVRDYDLDAVVGAGTSPAMPRVTGDPPPSHAASLPDRRAPVVIGGLGGSGTRIVAELAQGLGVHIGGRLNSSLDHLGFALLFKRPRWFASDPDAESVERAIELLERATFSGLADRLDPRQAALLDAIESDLAASRGSRKRIGVGADEVERLRRSPPTPFAGFCAWGWKEPNSHVFLDGLFAHFPRLRYVHVVRHGLDMAFSGNVNQLLNWGGAFGVPVPVGEPSPGAQLDYWIRTTQAIVARIQRGERILLLDFDALCTDPRGSVRTLAGFLGLACPEARLEALATIPKRPGSAGRYRERDLSIFSPAQLEAVRKLGFPIEPARSRRSLGSRMRALRERAWKGMRA